MSVQNEKPRRGRNGRGRRLRDGAWEGVINAWVPLDVAQDVKQLAIEEGRPIKAVVADALRRYIATVDAQPGTAPAERAAG